MKKSFVWIGAIGLLASACQSEGPQGPEEIGEFKEELVVTRTRWNGAAASASAYGLHDSIQLNVSEDKTTRRRSVSLNMYGYGYDPESEVCETDQQCYTDETTGEEICESYDYCYFADTYYLYGWGTIPSESFRVGRQLKSAQLTLDLADAPDFALTRCNQMTCESVQSGSIDVTWTENGAYVSSQSGTQMQKWGTYTFRSRGESTSVSADVSGSALGLDVSGYGDLSKSKGSSVSRDVSGGGTGGVGGTAGTGGISGFGGFGGTSGVGGVGGTGGAGGGM